MMYPYKFENIYVEKVWGGRSLESFRDNLPEGNIGESWEVSCHPTATSIVSNGSEKGLSLAALIEKHQHELVGTAISLDRFPLLMKFLDAKEELSIQVHPSDAYALEVENDLGKTEAWVVLAAGPKANMVLGTQNCTKADFKDALLTGADLEPYLNRMAVQTGDVYFIKSGLIHSMTDVLVAEIQQNSDTTYRVYDFNRGREIHVDKALDVMDLSLKGEKSTGVTEAAEGYQKIYYCHDHNFSLEGYAIDSSCTESSDLERFFIFTCTEGSGEIFYENGFETLAKGDSILIPASLGKYTFKGQMTLLKSYVPNVPQLEQHLDMLGQFC